MCDNFCNSLLGDEATKYVVRCCICFLYVRLEEVAMSRVLSICANGVAISGSSRKGLSNLLIGLIVIK